MKLNKKVKDEEFWPRLLLDKVKEKTNVKLDWDRYVDEDEADGKDFDDSALEGGNDFGGNDEITIEKIFWPQINKYGI